MVVQRLVVDNIDKEENNDELTISAAKSDFSALLEHFSPNWDFVGHAEEARLEDETFNSDEEERAECHQVH